MQPMNTQEALQLVLPIIDVFKQLSIAYRVGGSVASSYYGTTRATQDVDLIADIPRKHVQTLVSALDPNEYLIIDQSVIDAIQRQSSFNIIALRSMNKVDVFIHKHTPQADQEQLRAQPVSLIPGTPPIWLTSAEDMILEKILWWQLGGGQSSRQWMDIIGLIQPNGTALDRTYLQTTATDLGVTAVLQQAFADAGVPFP